MSAQELAAEQRPKPFRARSIILGLLLCAPASWITTGAPQDAMFSLLLAPVSILILLIVLNIPLRLTVPRLAFSQADLIMIFAITSVGATTGAEWTFISHNPIHALPYQADFSPLIKDKMLPNMPGWLSIKDPALAKDMAIGGHEIGRTVGYLPQLLPRYLAWAALMGFICLSMLCINSLMRGAWLRRERLSFPLIQLPVAMTEGGGSGGMWLNRYMWTAFAIMFSIDILNGINYLYPNVPSIPVKSFIDLQQFFPEPPMSNMGGLSLALFPFMAAVGIFVPSDLLFSIVLFYLLRKVTHVALAYYGIPQGTFSGTAIAPGPPYFDEQSWGGVFALFVTALYMSRNYLKGVWRDIRSGAQSDDGGIRHRWAFAGLVLCFAGVMWFGMQGDLPLTYLIPYFAIFLIFSFVLTRIRAQLGPPSHEFAYFGPSSVMHRFMGNRWLTDKQAVWVSQVFISMNRIHRTHPMPSQLEAMKMGETERLSQRTIFWAIAAATILGFLFSQFFLHAMEFRTGSVYRYADGESYLRTLLDNRHGPDVLGIAMTIFGFVFVVILDAIRFAIPAFPVHPAGYVLSLNYGVDYYWFGLLLALLVKNFVQRYYGMRGYDKLRNVALGILLAEYAAETIWTGIALITHQSTYTISFNDRSLGLQ